MLPVGQLFVGVTLLTAPLVLTRPRGRRLLTFVGVQLAYLSLCCILFGAISLSNLIILSVLYGLPTAWSGDIRIVRGRTFIELSNGDTYHGLSFGLWCLFTFAILGGFVFTAARIAKWAHSIPFVRRWVDEFSSANEAKRPAR